MAKKTKTTPVTAITPVTTKAVTPTITPATKVISNAGYGRPIVQMKEEAYRKWTTLVRLASGEISALGLVDETPDGPVITEIFLPKQTCTSSNSDMDQASVAEIIVEVAQRGEAHKLRAWIHSHAHMSVFWSGTDTGTIETIGANPYLVSVVTNKAGDVLTRIDMTAPFHITMDNLVFKISSDTDAQLEADCAAELNEKVTSQVWSSQTIAGTRWGGYGGYRAWDDDDVDWLPKTNKVKEAVEEEEVADLDDADIIAEFPQDLVVFARTFGANDLCTIRGIDFYSEGDMDAAVVSGVITEEEYLDALWAMEDVYHTTTYGYSLEDYAKDEEEALVV